MSVDLRNDPSGVAMARSPAHMDSRATLGTADVGVFGGSERGSGDSRIYRLGMLLPTASREQGRLFPSARVGDRCSSCRAAWGCESARRSSQRWLATGVVALGQDHDRICAPTSGSMSPSSTRTTSTIGSSTRCRAPASARCSRASTARCRSTPRSRSIRSSTSSRGCAGARASPGGSRARDGQRIFFQPALTLGTVRTPEGWAGTLLFDLAARATEAPYTTKVSYT